MLFKAALQREGTLLSLDDEAVVEVNIPGSESSEAILRKRTAGVLDMGGVSTQIAYEVPQTEEVAKNLLAEFNLGCDVHQTEHVYRVYVATFLGFGGNAARQRYEDRLFASTVQKNRYRPCHSSAGTCRLSLLLIKARFRSSTFFLAAPC